MLGGGPCGHLFWVVSFFFGCVLVEVCFCWFCCWWGRLDEQFFGSMAPSGHISIGSFCIPKRVSYYKLHQKMNLSGRLDFLGFQSWGFGFKLLWFGFILVDFLIFGHFLRNKLAIDRKKIGKRYDRR